MTTLSPTQARTNLSSLLKRAAEGEDIGILHGDQVIALRPVKIYSDDYALREYALSKKDLSLFVKRMDQEIAREYKAGKVRGYTGDFDADLAD